MAIEILKEGQLPSDEDVQNASFHGHCVRCGAEIRCLGSDGEISEMTSRNAKGPRFATTVRCPCCPAFIQAIQEPAPQ